MARIHFTPLLRPRVGGPLYWIYGLMQIVGVVVITEWVWGLAIEGRAPDRSMAETVLAAVLAARGLAWGVTMWAYLAVSLDNTRDLAYGALDASRPMMWVPAGLVLLSTLTSWGTVAGLAVLANATRLLVAARAPHRHGAVAPESRWMPADGVRVSILGAVALQSALTALGFDRPLWTAAWVVAGAAILTRAAIAKGAYRQKPA